jgi:hypothetical protein
VTEKVELLPCPFCGSADIDPTFWMSGDKQSTRKQGPGCNDCNATAESVADWNRRASA